MVNKYLKSRRALEGLSQSKMATNLKIALSTYCQKENGNRNFTDDEYLIISNMLNISIKDLILGGK